MRYLLKGSGASREERWAKLNTILDINKRAKLREDGLAFSVGYSCATWEQVKVCFPIAHGDLGQPKNNLPETLLNALHQYLCYATLCLGSIDEGREAKRVHFIAPIIIIVCAAFNGELEILAEEDVDGTRVHAHGHFEFVLKLRDKRICIVEAKKDDILQGKTQCLLGCESLCDIESLDVTYGVSTNYIHWCFLKNEASVITQETLSVFIEHERPTINSLQNIANKLIAILE